MKIIPMIVEALALGLSTGTYCVMYCAPVLLPFLCGRENLTHKKNLSLIGLFLSGRLIAYAALGIILGAMGLLVTEFFDPVMARHLGAIAYVLCGIVLLASGFETRLVNHCRLACAAKPPVDTSAKIIPQHDYGLACAAKQPASSNDKKGINQSNHCDALRSDGLHSDPPHSNGLQSDPLRVRLVSFFTGDSMVALLSGLTVGLHICPPFWTALLRSVASGNPVIGALYFLLFYTGTLPFFLPLLGIPFFSPRLQQLRTIARITQILVGSYFLLLAGIVPLIFER